MPIKDISQMHHKLSLTALTAALLLALGCEQTSLADPDPAAKTEAAAAPARTLEQVRDQTLVTVNGGAITGEMFGLYYRERMQKSPGSKNSPQAQNQAINELINVALLAQAAAKQGLDENPAVKTALNLQRSELLSRVALQEFAKNNPPEDEALHKAYDQQFKEAGEEYKARHILVKTEEEAKSLIQALDKGADFVELAKQHSTGPTGKDGGDLGWFDGSQMVKPFSDAVAAMEPGAISTEPVHTQFGWHVIELEEKRAKQPPEFEAVKAQLAAGLQRKALSEYVAKLREQAEIQVNETLSKPAAPEKTAE
jgi:peptidyl-prolyl cis-trans isomerase C